MLRRACVLALLATPMLVPREAAADPDQDPDTISSTEVESRLWSDDVQPLRTSHLIPITESIAFTLGLSAGAQIYGAPWSKITPTTMWNNVTGSWVWDEDPFSTDQIGHPYGGAWPFLAARSTGHGFWVSALYSFTSSLVWESLFETEPPSLNDQITTPIGGALIGESFHRMGRALRHGNPGVVRLAAATVLDPVGAFNREAWGKAWRDKLPPSYYAHVGLGWGRLQASRTGQDDNQLHAELVLQHGLPGDQLFVPHLPLDHFDLRGALDVSRDHVIGTINLRGLVVGRRFGGERGGGVYGLYGTYDFMNPDHVRVSAIGVGPGVAAELPLGSHAYLRATGVALLVPWGAAGGANEEERDLRDYHRGPGAAQIAELELGRRGLGSLRATSRLFEIDGSFVDDGRELIRSHTLGGRIALAKNHAIGVEGTLQQRSATFSPDRMDVTDRSLEARVFYALTAGSD